MHQVCFEQWRKTIKEKIAERERESVCVFVCNEKKCIPPKEEWKE